MVELGRWQLRVSDSKHFDIQNFGYALQWWAFTVFAVLFWLKAMRNVNHPPTPPGGGAELAVRSGGIGPAHSGPADLVVRSDQPGVVAAVYRGYVMPQSSTSPPRSDGDSYHAAYNDQLWQLALSDAARSNGTNGSRRRPSGSPPSGPPDPGPVVPEPVVPEPTALEPAYLELKPPRLPADGDELA